MNKELKATIIVISYNQERYIEQTLNSLLNQDTNFEFKILVFDDASTDSTLKKCIDIQAKNPEKMNIVSHKNNIGMMKNIVFAYKECTTEFVAICEGDDYWIDNKKLQTQVEFLESNTDYGMVFSDSDAIQVTTNEVYKNYFSKKLPIKEGRIYNELIVQSFIPTPTVCYRYKFLKSFFQEVDPIKEGWQMLDTPLSIYVSYFSKAKYLPYSSTMYRIHEVSSSNFQNLEKKLDFFVSKLKMKLFFLRMCNSDEKIYIKVFSSTIVDFLSLIYHHKKQKKGNKILFLLKVFIESIINLIKKILNI